MPPLSSKQQASQNFLNSSPSLPTSTGGAGNWWEKLLPTLGSIAAPAIGAALAPETGGLSLLATAGLGAAGGAAGKGAENMLTNQNLSEGLGGAAAGGALGGALGKGAGALMQNLGGALERTGQNAAMDAATQGAIRPYVGLSMKNAVPTMEHIKSLNIDTSNPQNIIDFVDKYSGAEGAHASDLVRNAMGDTPVDLASTRELANSIGGSPEMQTAGAGVGKKFSTVVNNVLKLNQGGTYQVPAGDVYQARQLLQKLAFKPKIDPNLSQGYRDVMGSLDDALTRSGVDNIVVKTGLPPEVYQQAIRDGGQEFADKLQTAANTGVGALRSFQKPLMDARELAQMAIDKANGKIVAEAPQEAGKGGGLLGSLFGGGVGKLAELGGGAEALLGHPGIGIPAFLGGAAMNFAKANPEQAGSILKGVGGSAIPIAAAQALTNGAGAQGSSSMVNTADKQTGSNRAAGGYDPNELASYLLQSIMVNPYQAASLAPVLASVLGPLQQSNKAEASLQGLQGLYGQATQGPGILNALMGLIPGTAASQYNQQKGAVGSQLAAAGIPTALPSLMASPSVAQSAFASPLATAQAQGNPGSFQGYPSVLGSVPPASY